MSPLKMREVCHRTHLSHFLLNQRPGEQVAMPTPSRMADSFDLLSKLVSKHSDLTEGSAIINGVRHFMEKNDGPGKALGEILVEGRKDFFNHPEILPNRREWAKILLSASELSDERTASSMDLTEADEEDIKAAVTLLAVEMLQKDRDFRRACLLETAMRDPSMLEEIKSEAERIRLGIPEVEPHATLESVELPGGEHDASREVTEHKQGPF